MATKRTPLNRDRRRRVHPEAVAAFKRVLAVQDVRDECLRGRCTANPKSLSEHCPACAEYLNAKSALSLALAISPWEPSPCDVDGPEPPGGMMAGTVYAEAWPEIWKLRQALDKAAQEATCE